MNIEKCELLFKYGNIAIYIVTDSNGKKRRVYKVINPPTTHTRSK